MLGGTVVALEGFILMSFAAALLSAFVAAFVWVAIPTHTLAVRYFVALNVFCSVWAGTQFLQLTQLAGREPSVAAFGSPGSLLWVLMLAGVCGTTLCWFFFAAAQANRDDILHGWPAWLAWAWTAYSIAAGITNPWHHLFATQTAAGQPVHIGALATAQILGSLVFGIWGIVLVVGDLWSRGHAAHRGAAIWIGAAVILGWASALVWTFKDAIGLHVPAHLTPVVMPLVTVVLAWAAMRGYLGDMVPLSASRAKMHAEEPAIAVNDRRVVVALNHSAEELLPPTAVGRMLDDFLPAIAGTACDAMASVEGYRVFEHRARGRTYWGRATCTRVGEAPLGCLITLADITEEPDTLRELHRHLGHEVMDDRGVLSRDVKDIVEQL